MCFICYIDEKIWFYISLCRYNGYKYFNKGIWVRVIVKEINDFSYSFYLNSRIVNLRFLLFEFIFLNKEYIVLYDI